MRHAIYEKPAEMQEALGSDCPTLLLGIGTAVPANSAAQNQAMEFALNVMGNQPGLSPGLIRRIHQHSGIERRHSVLPDFLKTDPADFTFFPQNWSLLPAPATAARMSAYEAEALPLAKEAALRAIEAAGIDADQITHLVLSTCTGFFAPGLDILLLRELGIPLTAHRCVLGFMGCYAGLSALRACHQIVQADPSAFVLQVSVELCSLHYQVTPTVETVVSNAIFSDGAAAAVYGGNCDSSTAPAEGALAQVVATHSDVSADSLDRMSWRIGDHGFIMTLDAGVPGILQDHAPEFVDDLAAAGGVERDEISGWAVHPGGRKIVEAVQQALELNSADVQSSVDTLRDFGNMSSATILFVLKQELERDSAVTQGLVAAMAFGPGLTMEGALLRRA